MLKIDSWVDFFSSTPDVADDFSTERHQQYPQKRDEENVNFSCARHPGQAKRSFALRRDPSDVERINKI